MFIPYIASVRKDELVPAIGHCSSSVMINDVIVHHR